MISKSQWRFALGFLAAGLATCIAHSATKREHRLPKDLKWGRCLLIVNGKTRISGKCAYKIEQNGEFYIEGPRQIHGGIDYPEPEIHADEQSRDYWASIYKDKKGWWGYGNEDILSTHGEGDSWRLLRQGVCYTGTGKYTKKGTVRICLWRK